MDSLNSKKDITLLININGNRDYAYYNTNSNMRGRRNCICNKHEMVIRITSY